MSKGTTILENNTDSKSFNSVPSPNDKNDKPGSLFSRLLRLNSFSNKTQEKPTIIEPPTVYYGVYIPCEVKKGPDIESLHVYKNKKEALDLVKRYKIARFKAFGNHQDAVTFALQGAEPVDVVDGNSTSLIAEKPYPFKSPTPQEMVALRKSIEQGLLESVREKIWENPRFLVSSGSTPSIMQEGSRYNALHVAAKAGNAELCDLILTTVGNPDFIQTLYGSDADPESCKEFASILVDRYLNTPDKGMNETPLHFASKYGAEAAIEVLTSFPQCDRNALNKYGHRPADIICERGGKASPGCVERIRSMLGDRYFVPVLHSEDDSAPPTIGRPFTPALPPELNVDRLSPRYEIRAYAGPMEEKRAEAFRRRWRTPPRARPPLSDIGSPSPFRSSATTGSPAPLSSPAHFPSPAQPVFRLNDLAKGFETVGRDLADTMKVGWKEYWPFLDTFTDLRTAEGLALLENYLKTKYETDCSIFRNNSAVDASVTRDTDLTVSRISLGNLSQISPIKENTLSPMSELCVAMKTCTISKDRPPHWRQIDPIRQKICRQPIKMASLNNGDSMPVSNHTFSQLLCVERTCQVFAKRIADSLALHSAGDGDATEHLRSEAKYLQHTILTYKDDERFRRIDFASIHSRLAQLVVYKLQQALDASEMNILADAFLNTRHHNEDMSSDEESRPISYRSPGKIKLTRVIDHHVRCLVNFISDHLRGSDGIKGPSVSETECRLAWQNAPSCKCDWKLELLERNSKKNASFRKNRSQLSTSPKSDGVVRRLYFDHDIGDVRGGAGDAGAADAQKSSGVNCPAEYTIDTSNCQVLSAEISDDDSDKSSDEVYQTASEGERSLSDDDEMHDCSDRALVDVFIYGQEPSKMDRLVYDALAKCELRLETYPSIYRWRHTISLYTPEERQSWQPSTLMCDEGSDRPRRTPACSTPTRDRARDHGGRPMSLQVSSWLRVTGPNSPRSVLTNKNVSHNVSFGF